MPYLSSVPGLLVLTLLAVAPARSLAADPAAKPPRSRAFTLTYAAKITGLPTGQTARIWVPLPPSNEDQDVQIVARDVPAGAKETREARYGNAMLYVEATPSPAGEVALSLTYRVLRREVRGAQPSSETGSLARFLQPDSKVPVGGKSLELLRGQDVPRNQVAAARVLYDVVNRHMRYSKEGTGWGQGDVLWVCENGYGNCSDFHSLFISLARAHQIPARFEIGYPLPTQRGRGDIAGYHCWARFHAPGRGWIPVDISEASKNPALRDYYFGNLTEDRVAFSIGRDVDLAPQQEGPPLNFFIYPYVEVGGKPHPLSGIERKVSFRDE